MTRQTKTPKQRAEERLGVAQRTLARLRSKRTKLAEQVDALAPEIAEAEARVTYASEDPALTTEDDTLLPDSADSGPDNPDEEQQ